MIYARGIIFCNLLEFNMIPLPQKKQSGSPKKSNHSSFPISIRFPKLQNGKPYTAGTSMRSFSFSCGNPYLFSDY